MRVRAKLAEGKFGYYEHVRRHNGDVFDISDDKKKETDEFPLAFSHKWMEAVDQNLPPVKVQKETGPRKPASLSKMQDKEVI